jgi:hypothetical protein
MPTQAEISLNPTSATGDILSHNGTSRIRVAAGTAAQILVARSSATSGLSWETPPSSSSNYELVVSASLTTAASLIQMDLPAGRGTTYKHFLLIATTYKSTDDEYQTGAGYILLNNVTTGSSSQSFAQLNTYGGGASDKYSDTGTFFTSYENGFSESDGLSSIEMEIFGEGPNVMILHKAYNGRTANGDPVFTLVNQNGLSMASLTSISLWTGSISYTYKVGTKVYLYGLKAYGA